jgi:hypothetical protein
MTTRKRATLEEYLEAAERLRGGIVSLIGVQITEEERHFRDEALGQSRVGELIERRRIIKILDQLHKRVRLHPILVPSCFAEIGRIEEGDGQERTD